MVRSARPVRNGAQGVRRIAGPLGLCAGLLLAAAPGCTGKIGGSKPEGAAGGVGSGAPGAGGGSGSGPPPVGSPQRPDGYGEPSDPLAVGFDCDQQADPSVAPLKRLTVLQYQNTLADLFDASTASAAVDAARDALAQLPIDGEEEESFTNMDGRVSQRHVDGYFNVADQIATALIDDSSRLAAIAGDCATNVTVDGGCLRDFISDFGAKVFRRPLRDAEVARYAELNEPGTAAQEVYRGVVFTLLMAPPFLYHLEVEGTTVDARAEFLQLDAYELASRLSYHFWQTMPDEPLFEAAASGRLETQEGYREQVDRMWNDPRTEAAVLRFYEDWYHLDVFGGFATTPAFETFRGDTRADADVYWDSVREIEALVRYFTFEPGGGSYRDILTTDLSFTDSPVLATIYGAAPWDGVSAPSSLPPGTRSGLLTRAAMLISSNHTTNPFKRGAFVRRELLCVPVKPPANLPADALNPPPFDPNASTRERFAQKVAPDECAGCHATFQPFGFALEAYDGLGRFRTEETIIDDDGDRIRDVPVDTRVAIQIRGGDDQTVSGPIEMSEALADSGMTDECFARHYFRYTFRRGESIGDECTLNTILENVRGTQDRPGDLKRAMLEVALQDAFQHRVVE